MIKQSTKQKLIATIVMSLWLVVCQQLLDSGIPILVGIGAVIFIFWFTILMFIIG